MGRVIVGTVSVTGGGTIVTAWSGTALTELNCPPGSPVTIQGMANFVKERLSVSSFELEIAHAGAGGTLLATGISAFTPVEVSAGTLNARTAQVIQELDTLDANGRGLFYNMIGVTGDNDPGPGNIALDNADPTLVTEIYLDVLDANDTGRDVSGIIELFTSGTVLILRSLASNAYAAYQVSGAPTDETGYYKILAGYVGHDGSLANEPMAVEWRLPGADLDVDAEVNDIAGRATYDLAATGFRVLVRDTGSGRAGRYTKLSGASADWSAVAYYTGPVGATGPTGPIGVNWIAPWSGATAYVLNDGVLHNSSSWRCLVAHTNQTPPTLPTTSNTYWSLIAAKGADGAGTGDVVGPASSVDGGLVVFDGPTGKIVKTGTALTAAQQGIIRANIAAEVLSGTRNKLDNPDFDIWQRGTSTTPVSATVQFGPDRWTAYQTGANVNWDRVAFTVGQTDVPGEPEFFAQVTAGGGSALSIGQRMEGVRTLAGKVVTVTGYLKGNAARTCEVALRQQFGSGGSSTVVTTMGTATIANGTWTKFSFTTTLPSISGKTVGADNSLGMYFENFNLAGFQFSVAHVSVVEGDATAEADPCPVRNLALEWIRCRRFYRIVRFRGLRTATAATEFLSQVFATVDMRATPTTSVLGTDSLTNISALTTDVSGADGGTYVQVYGTSSASGSCAFTATRGLSAEIN